MHGTLAFLFGLAVAVLPISARAWGSTGHEIVAAIAAARLTPAARTEVERLLGDRAGNALREAANWADQSRAASRGRGARLHYVNFPRGECRYVAERDCSGGRCVVAALARHARALAQDGERQSRAEALRWVVHLVGDVHQPLHAAWADDRGGNDVQLRYQGRGTNLHALLDTGLLRASGLDAPAYTRVLEREQAAPPVAVSRWDGGAPVRWAEESCALADRVYPEGRRVEPAFAARTRALLEQRLFLAGLRLASTLNHALDPSLRQVPR